MFRNNPLPQKVYRTEFDAARKLGIPISAHIGSSEEAKGQIEAHAKENLLGKDVQIAIRPERIALERSGQGGPNAIPGTVEAAIFVGSFQVFLVRADIQDSLLHVQIPAAGTTASFRQGDKVDLVAEPDAIRLFPVAEA